MSRPNSLLKYSVYQWYQLPEPTFVPELTYQMIESLFEAALLKQLIRIELVSQFQSTDGSRGF